MDPQIIATLTELGVAFEYNTMLLYGIGGVVGTNFLSLLWLMWQHTHVDAEAKRLLGQVIDLQQQLVKGNEAAGRTAEAIREYILELANRVGRLNGEDEVMPLIPKVPLMTK